MPSSTDRIEKSVVFDAPRQRVWRAITDVAQFNQWFGVVLVSPFTPGAEITGKIDYPGYEHLDMTLWIDRIEPERFFSFRWHPHAIDPNIDYSDEPKTLVTFTVEDSGAKTKLTLHQSGFEAIEGRVSHVTGWTSCFERFAHYMLTVAQGE